MQGQCTCDYDMGIKIYFLKYKLLFSQVLQKRSKSDPDIFEDLNMPIDQIEVKCENKNCRSTDKVIKVQTIKFVIIHLKRDEACIIFKFNINYDQI